MALKCFFEGKKEKHYLIEIEERQIPLVVRRNPRARRVTLRINMLDDGVIVTIPYHVSNTDAIRFAHKKASWICGQLDAIGERILFEDGVKIPFQGVQFLVRHRGDVKGSVWKGNGEINVAGGVEDLSRRLHDWLKKQARFLIVSRAYSKAAQINRKPTRITLRDTRTRWGSCSFEGRLSFSWRLIMAPPEILDYVVAHEVSHLAHMNHSSIFWKTVDQLTKNAWDCREWLHANGNSLHRIG